MEVNRIRPGTRLEVNQWYTPTDQSQDILRSPPSIQRMKLTFSIKHDFRLHTDASHNSSKWIETDSNRSRTRINGYRKFETPRMRQSISFGTKYVPSSKPEIIQ